MKNVYLIQPNCLLSGEIHLPYAAGAIAAYAWQFREIADAYTLCDIFFKKEPVEQVLARIKNPDFVGFSCYMWNIEYNLALAAAIKQKFPQCVIAFGGPEVPDDTEYLEKYASIDILMYGEGEITFYFLLKTLLQNKSLKQINNIAFRECGEIIKTPRSYNKDLSAFPSPYAAGMFDKIMRDPANKIYRFSAVLETNRGCPYQCAYCYWAGTVKNFRIFPMQRIKTDLDWIAEHKIAYCLNADSNFGVLERDMEITDYVVQKKKECGYPIKYESCAAKNKEDVVFAINQKLHEVDMSCGISVAVQSMSPTVLKNIGRENISISNFAQQLAMYRKAGMSPYTDFILALPGETYESFMQGIFMAIEAGQHDYFNVHPLEVLPNTRLYTKEYRRQFGIQTVKSKLFQVHLSIDEEIEFASRSEIVVATDTMTREDWVKAYRFSVMIQVVHSFSFLRFFALYLRKTEGISYETFYTDVYKKICENGGFIRTKMNTVFQKVESFAHDKSDFNYYDNDFSHTFLYYKEALLLHFMDNREAFYTEMREYLLPYFSDLDLFEDLLRYQFQKMKHLHSKCEVLHFEYDWQSYFADILDKENPVPQKKSIAVTAEGCKEHDWKEYTKHNIWYGKREQKMVRRFTGTQ